MTQKMHLLSDRNTQLESRVKHLEVKLLENNIIMYGVKESKWELDSTCNELMIQMLSSTVSASTGEEYSDLIFTLSGPLQLYAQQTN